jgi:hypothetical protein
MSKDDAKSAIERMTPEEQIIAFSKSPLPQSEKEKKYKEIEEKTGVKAAEVLNQAAGGAPTTQ